MISSPGSTEDAERVLVALWVLASAWPEGQRPSASTKPTATTVNSGGNIASFLDNVFLLVCFLMLPLAR